MRKKPTHLLSTLSLLTGCSLTAGVLGGCTSSAADSSVFSQSGGTESKPVATEAALFSGSGLDATAAAPTLAASVTYVILVTSNSGDEVCHGNAQINIMSNFTMQFPEATITCLSLNIDLASILGNSFATSGTLSNLSSDGKMLYVSEIANATFTPPRPFLLGPVIQNPSVYQGYQLNQAETVVVNDPTNKLSNVSAQGQIAVNVVQVNTTYSNTLSPNNQFSNVLDWTMTTSGFAGIPASDGLLLQSIEWFWNTSPIMIPKIVIKGDLSNFISSSGGGTSGASQLIGNITIDLSVQSYNFGT